MKRYKKSLSVIIAEELKKKITDGIYRHEDQLPAEADIARELGASRAILRESLSMLDRQGFVTRKHGDGSFVAKPEQQILSSFDKLDLMMDLLRRSGIRGNTYRADHYLRSAGGRNMHRSGNFCRFTGNSVHNLLRPAQKTGRVRLCFFQQQLV